MMSNEPESKVQMSRSRSASLQAARSASLDAQMLRSRSADAQMPASARASMQAHASLRADLQMKGSREADPLLYNYPLLMPWDWSSQLNSPYDAQTIQEIAEQGIFYVNWSRLYVDSGQSNLASIRAQEPRLLLQAYHEMHSIQANYPWGRPLAIAYYDPWIGREGKHLDGSLAQAWQPYPLPLEGYWTNPMPEAGDIGYTYAKARMDAWEAAWRAIIGDYDIHPDWMQWDYIHKVILGPYITPLAESTFGKLDFNQNGIAFDADAAEITAYRDINKAYSEMLDRLYPQGLAQIPNGKGLFAVEGEDALAGYFHGIMIEQFPDPLAGTRPYDVLANMFESEWGSAAQKARFRTWTGNDGARPRWVILLTATENMGSKDLFGRPMAARMGSMIFQCPYAQLNTNTWITTKDPKDIINTGDALGPPIQAIVDEPTGKVQYKRNYEGGLAILEMLTVNIWKAQYHAGVFNDDPDPIDGDNPIDMG